nr:retrotransposable element Tf2 [Tanacetum cinerariifolium]
MTPFKAVYGREASSIHEYSPGINVTASIDATLIEHQRLTEILKEALDRSRHRMTKQENKHRMEKQFQVESHGSSSSSKFPTEWLTNSPSLEPQPENILQRRITWNKEEVLVKWKHHDTSEATW